MSMSECELLTVKFEAELIAVMLDRCELQLAHWLACPGKLGTACL